MNANHRIASLLTLSLLNAAPALAADGQTAKEAYEDITKTFGFVPSFLKAYPEIAIAGAWEEMKAISLNPKSPVAGKYRELIALGVAAQIPCEYCVYFHTEAAKLNGASEQEIREAVALAAATRHWSTYINGMQLDEAAFRKDTDHVIENLKAPAPAKGTPVVVRDSATAYRDIEATLGFVPGFMKAFPEDGIAGAWRTMKTLDLNPATALPGKYKQLIQLGVAAQVPCRYCTYFHDAAAKLTGANEGEIKESLAVASQVRLWSAVANGNQVDKAQFKKEVDRIMNRFRKLASATP